MLSVLMLALALQTLPLTVNIGVTPDASGATLGYTVQVDAAAAVDVGLPATNPACKAFVGGAISSCVEFPVSITTAGSHTVSIVAYNLAGNSAPATITFSVGTTPSTPSGLKIVR